MHTDMMDIIEGGDYDTQTALITSEQRRLHLEQELKKMMGQSNKSERLREIQLRTQMDNLKVQRQKSMERNRMIRRQMQEFEVNLSAVSAKTQRLRTLKIEYEDYIERLYPQWKEQVLAKAAEKREKDARRQAMTRDIYLTEQLSVPDLTRSQSEGFSPQHSLPTDSHNDLSSAPLPSDLSLHDLSLICSPTNKPQASSSPANTAAIKCNKPYKKQAKNKKRKPESVSKPSPVPTDTVPLVHTSQSKVNGHMTGHSSHLKRSSPHQYNYHSVFSADTPDRAQSINPSRSQIQAMVMSSLSHDEQISLGVSSSKVTSDSQTDDKVIFLPASLFCDSTVPDSRIPYPGYYEYSSTGPQATGPQATGPQADGTLSQQSMSYPPYPHGGAHPQLINDSHQYRPGSSQARTGYPQPHRSSTPDHSAPRQDRGLVSTSLQSLHSEKSVTFDESSLRRELGPSSSQPSPSLSRLSPRDLISNQSNKQRSSPRRQTPSPSELIRMSMDSQNSSRHGSQASLLDFDSRQPTQSQSIKPAFDQSQTSFNLTGQSTYPDFSRSQPDIGRPPISQPSPSQSMTTANPNDSKTAAEPVYAQVHKTPPVSTDYTDNRQLQPEIQAPSAASSAPVKSVTEQRRYSGSQVVIPSTEDIVDDVESLQEAVVDDRLPLSLPDELSPEHRPSHGDIGAPEVRHSLSSLNTTIEDQQPDVELAKTAEFKNLLTGTMASTQNLPDDDTDSEDSMAALENQMQEAYKQQALNKTNTMHIGHNLAPPPADLLPSDDDDEDSEEEDSIDQPMGYTPSFQTNTNKQSEVDSTQAPAVTGEGTASAVGGMNSSTGALSGAGTGGSKSSQSSRIPIFSRTGSDVESETDFGDVSTNKKPAAGGGDDNDDFDDFYD